MTGTDQRRTELRELISVPGEKVNVDMLMDVVGKLDYLFLQAKFEWKVNR